MLFHVCPVSTTDVRDGWLVFPVAANECALGENLLGVRVVGRDVVAQPLFVEKLELRVRYREPQPRGRGKSTKLFRHRKNIVELVGECYSRVSLRFVGSPLVDCD